MLRHYGDAGQSQIAEPLLCLRRQLPKSRPGFPTNRRRSHPRTSPEGLTLPIHESPPSTRRIRDPVETKSFPLPEPLRRTSLRARPRSNQKEALHDSH